VLARNIVVADSTGAHAENPPRCWNAHTGAREREHDHDGGGRSARAMGGVDHDHGHAGADA
jgi:hypothetical protein